MLHIFKALRLSKWSRGRQKGSNLSCTRSGLSGPVWLRPGKPHRKSSGCEERQSKSTWHPAAPRSQFENIPVSFLLNKHLNYDGCGEVTLAEGKEEMEDVPFLTIATTYLCLLCASAVHSADFIWYILQNSLKKICMTNPLIWWETWSSEIRRKEFLQRQSFVTSKTIPCLSFKGTKLENL